MFNRPKRTTDKMAKSGKFGLTLAGASALTAQLALVQAAPLKTTPISGTIGALTAQIHAAATTKLVSVVDFTRNLMTAFARSANNVTRCQAALGISGSTVYTFVPSTTAARSAGFVLKDSSGITKSAPFEVSFSPGLSPATATINGADVANNSAVDGLTGPLVIQNGTPLADNRSALEKSLAAAIEPSMAAVNAAGLINGVADALAANGLHGFMLIDDFAGTFSVYVMPSGSDVTVFEDGSVPSIDANSLLGVFNVNVPAGTSQSLI